jgi:hypothetical protein
VTRRRALVESLHKAPPEQLSGDSIARIQSAIEAVDRAIHDESQIRFGSAEASPALSAESRSLPANASHRDGAIAAAAASRISVPLAAKVI